MSDGPKMRAVVTGGGTGVGRATALLLAKRGYDVAINYSRSESEAEQTVEQIREHGVDAFSIQADVSDRSEVVAMAQAIQSRWSG
ncbi:MAG: SDR family NAD(P)-dependent oxidoreductase, partial [Planctomycetota bacterium]|nr:SDR family NAD(P)-dependent oxidoreductase [Planctomycetota bacterium]